MIKQLVDIAGFIFNLMGGKVEIRRDINEVIEELISKHKFAIQGHDFGKYWLGDAGDEWHGVMKFYPGGGRCDTYGGDKYIERVLCFLEELMSATGIRCNITKHLHETNFIGHFDHHPEAINKIFRIKDIFSSSHEYYDEYCKKNLYVGKHPDYGQG